MFPGILTVTALVQPLLSVPVTVYVPAVLKVAVSPVCPSDHRKVYPGVPPLAEAVAVALETQVTEPETVALRLSAGGWVSVAEAVAVPLPPAPVTVTVYVPAARLMAV